MTAAATIGSSLRTAVRFLGSRSESPRLDAEILLCKVLGIPRSALVVRGDDIIAAERRGAYEGLVQRRAQGVPVAYLTGAREFWSLELAVTPDVLVPRPETELLVELALQRMPLGPPASVLDLGTGSGAIALAIASERPGVRITGTDVCRRALGVATANARALGLPHLAWRLGSWFEAVPGERFDIIVANPPYVGSLDPALRQLAAEPALALTGGRTGLEALTDIIDGAPAHLLPRGWLLLEHGSTQAGQVAALLARRGFGAIRAHVDYAGMNRVTLATFHSSQQEHS